MGAIDNFLDFLKIERDDDYDDDYYEEEKVPEKPAAFPPKPEESEEEEKPFKRPTKPAGNVRNRKGGSSVMEVTRIKPSSIEDGRKITNLLLEGKVVFLDLEGIDMELAQRIIDYVSGANYAIDGTLSQMSKFTFVIAPSAVNVSGDFQEPSVGETSVVF